MNTVLNYVDTHSERMLADLLAYIEQPSISRTGEGFPRATEYAASLVERSGLAARIVPTAGLPLVLGTAAGPPGTPHVLIYGHYDVQPAGPLEEWHSPPFAPEVREGRVYGRGAGDNKGQHLAHLLAIEALHALHGGLPCTVTVLLDGEEEIGSPNLPAALAGMRDELGADLVLWSDGPVHENGQATVVLGVRGILTFQLRVHSSAYPLHSGNWGGVAPNPAWRLVHLLATMRSPDGVLSVDGLTDAVRPFSPAERAALDALPIDEDAALKTVGLSTLDVPEDRGWYERLGLPTLTINSLSCEDSQEHRTVIPNVAVARCDVRMVADQRAADVEAALRRHVERYAPDVELTVTGAMEPSRTSPETPYTAAIVDGAAEGLREQPLLVPALGGSLPLYVFTEVLGLPCYGVPFANADEANHAPNENIEVRRFLGGISASAAILGKIGALGGSQP